MNKDGAKTVKRPEKSKSDPLFFIFFFPEFLYHLREVDPSTFHWKPCVCFILQGQEQSAHHLARWIHLCFIALCIKPGHS